MEKHTLNQKLFAIFKKKEKTFAFYFILNSMLSSLNKMKILYMDFFVFVIVGIVGYFYRTDGLINLFGITILIYFFSLYILEKYKSSKAFIFDLYTRIEEELYEELFNGNKITELNNYRQEIESFLLEFDGMEIRKDTLSYSFRNST